jgi:hypothetical protein
MAEKKNLVEDALLQMKNLEEAVAENAKGILAATMGQEISELVKESLKEQTDDEAELDVDMDMDDEEGDEESSDIDMDMDTDNDDVEMDMDMDMTDDMSGMDDMDDETVDLTNASDEEILKVFKAMGEDDGIIVKKDNNSINLKDENEDTEYDIHLGESEEMETAEMDEMWGPYESDDEEEDESGFSFDDEEEDESGFSFDDEDFEMPSHKMKHKSHHKPEFSFDDEEDEGVVYEIEMDEKDKEEEDEEVVYEIEMDEDEHMEDYSEAVMDEDETYDFTKTTKAETKEGTMSVKPKGVGMGKAKFSYKSQKGGFKEDMKKGNPTMGTGKPKFDFKEGKKSETKEAARTLGNGSKNSPMRKGLPKPKVRADYRNESVNNELNILREKNEEYRKALNIFRQKLNEVAVFNSNLAYATRLFTEHSTSKQEKINVLRRFDGVESIKESKNLYKTLKEELSGKEGKVVTESIENKIDRAPQSGSAANLIESKTYENPQFMRMKDLMSKLK